jgi:hypothetical protein
MKHAVKIIIALIIAIAAYVLVENPVEARDPILEEVKPFHKMDFGFNLGFFNDVPIETSALKTLKEDGLNHIMFYEPWSANKTNEEIVSYINELVKKGFTVEVSLSNFPKEKGAKFKDYYKEHGKKTSPMPKGKLKRSYKFSNRFPPSDYQAYKDTLKHLLNLVKAKGIEKKVSFEIGSEPNANLYFWGDADDFRKYYNTVRPILKKAGFDMTCCGYSTGYFGHPRERANAMHKDFDKFIKRDGITQSYSMYLTTWGTRKTNLGTFTPNYTKNSVISAYGTYAKLNDKTDKKMVARNKELDAGSYMTQTLKMIKFSYKNKVKRAYLWKLLDVPKKRGTAGYFKVGGVAKPRYQQWKTIHNVINEGFYVVQNDSKVHIVGKTSTMIFAKKESIAQFDPKRKVVKSYQYDATSRQLEKNGWIVVSHK